MKLSKIIFLLAVASFVSFKMMAQGSLPGDPDTGVPLDGGLSIAIVAGVSYGAKRLMKNKKAAAENKK